MYKYTKALILSDSFCSKYMATFFSTASNGFFMAAAFLLLLGIFAAKIQTTEAQIGVCYGMLGNNLPQAQDVINLYKSKNIRRMRIYDPSYWALEALKGSNIELMMGVPNSDLESLSNPSNAHAWVQKNIVKYWPSVKFRYIAVGNEVSPFQGYTTRYAKFVLPALVNVFNAVRAAGLHNNIKVSIAIDMTLIGTSYPPSQGSFRNDVKWYLDPIIGHLAWAKTPLLANIYTYFSYSYNPGQISLPYALFQCPGPIVWDSGRGYQNLFDAMLDSLYSALERSNGGSLDVVVSESGWPSDGAFGATYENARAYYTNLVNHVSKGTPKRPGKAIETYLFAMFDENNKEPQLEKHFGVFYPNKSPKYQLWFGGERNDVGLEDVSGDMGNVTVSYSSDM